MDIQIYFYFFENRVKMKKIVSVFILFVIFAGLSAQDKFTDKRDGNIYKTISVSGVTWMSENLNYKPKDGASYFDNDANNGPAYGILYDWKTAMNVCPAGWHLPAGADFQVLSNYFEHKETWGKIKYDPTSFGIQLGGMQNFEGVFSEMDESGYYWTSTEYDKASAEYFSYLIINEMPVIDISRKADITDIHGTEKLNKYSVRCIKD
jgi:uncharacterized protein (TIGR02145 family)